MINRSGVTCAVPVPAVGLGVRAAVSVLVALAVDEGVREGGLGFAGVLLGALVCFGGTGVPVEIPGGSVVGDGGVQADKNRSSGSASRNQMDVGLMGRAG
jgi:hypothetical protein